MEGLHGCPVLQMEQTNLMMIRKKKNTAFVDPARPSDKRSILMKMSSVALMGSPKAVSLNRRTAARYHQLYRTARGSPGIDN